MNLSRVMTSILFILVLAFVYANLPEKVALWYDPLNEGGFEMEKSMFFYASVGVLLVINLLNTIFVRAIESVPVRPEKMFFTNDWFKETFLAWMAAFAPVMNLFFIFGVAFIGIYNNGDIELIESYGYLAFLGQFLVLVWLITVIPIVLIRNNK